MLWWTLRELKADDWRKREEAARKLGEIDDPRIIEPLLATLKDKNPRVRQSASDALVSIGAPAVRSLVHALKSKHHEARQSAEDALVRIGTPAVIPLGLALYERDSAVREAAAVILGQIGNAAAVEQLISAIKYGEFGIKEAAAAGLVRIGARAVTPLMGALKDNKTGVRETAAAALVRIGPAAIEPLVAALEDSEVREAATEALWKIDPNWAKSDAARGAVPTMVTNLRSGDEKMRKAAATMLGEVGEHVAFDALMESLADSNENVQEAAAHALGQREDPRAIIPLVAVLQHGGAKARRAASAALVKIGNGLIEPLVAALKDSNPAVREAAAAVCVRMGHSAVEPLAEALWQIDPDWAKSPESKSGVPRFVAALREGESKLLGSTADPAKRPGGDRGSKPVVSTLKAKAVERSEPVRSSPFGADSDVRALVEALNSPDAEARSSARTSLMQLGRFNDDGLILALKNKSQTIRRAAAHALAAAGDARGRDVLRLDLKDPSPFVQLDAADSLVSLRDVSAAQPLIKILSLLLEAPADQASLENHQARRVYRLLLILLERDAAEIVVEDLHALVQLKLKRAPQFISSIESNQTSEAAQPEKTILPASEGDVDLSKLRELARSELSRRSHKPKTREA